MASGMSGVDLSTIPLQQPPPGEVTNFVNPPSISWAGRLAIYLTLPIMVVAFSLRMFVRIRTRQIGADDYLLILGSAAAVTFCALLLPVFTKDVLGRHAWDIPVIAIQPWFFEYSVAAGCVYNISAMFTKVSILALYSRVFGISRRTRYFVWFGDIFIMVGYLALTAAMLYYLLPHAGDGGWGSTANRTRMGDPSRILDFTQGIFSLITDFYVLIIPVFVIKQLKLPMRKKIGVTCIFLAGLLSCGCSLAGVVYRHQALVFTVVDNRWNSVKFEALCAVELNVGILCACIPVFFILFKTLAERTESGLIYLRDRLSTRKSSQEMSSKGTGEDFPNKPTPRFNIKSFSRSPGWAQTRDKKPNSSDSSVPPYLELQSVDSDYHAHIGGRPHVTGSNR